MTQNHKKICDLKTPNCKRIILPLHIQQRELRQYELHKGTVEYKHLPCVHRAYIIAQIGSAFTHVN